MRRSELLSAISAVSFAGNFTSSGNPCREGEQVFKNVGREPPRLLNFIGAFEIPFVIVKREVSIFLDHIHPIDKRGMQKVFGLQVFELNSQHSGLELVVNERRNCAVNRLSVASDGPRECASQKRHLPLDKRSCDVVRRAFRAVGFGLVGNSSKDLDGYAIGLRFARDVTARLADLLCINRGFLIRLISQEGPEIGHHETGATSTGRNAHMSRSVGFARKMWMIISNKKLDRERRVLIEAIGASN